MSSQQQEPTESSQQVVWLELVGIPELKGGKDVNPEMEKKIGLLLGYDEEDIDFYIKELLRCIN